MGPLTDVESLMTEEEIKENESLVQDELSQLDPDTIFGTANPPEGKKYDFSQVDGWVGRGQNGFGLSWLANGVGFGDVYFEFGPNGQVHIDTEYMSNQFLEELLLFMLSKATKDQESKDWKTGNDYFQEGLAAEKGTECPYKEEKTKEYWVMGYNSQHEE